MKSEIQFFVRNKINLEIGNIMQLTQIYLVISRIYKKC